MGPIEPTLPHFQLFIRKIKEHIIFKIVLPAAKLSILELSLYNKKIFCNFIGKKVTKCCNTFSESEHLEVRVYFFSFHFFI